jgi:hypothetical protein
LMIAFGIMFVSLSAQTIAGANKRQSARKDGQVVYSCQIPPMQLSNTHKLQTSLSQRRSSRQQQHQSQPRRPNQQRGQSLQQCRSQLWHLQPVGGELVQFAVMAHVLRQPDVVRVHTTVGLIIGCTVKHDKCTADAWGFRCPLISIARYCGYFGAYPSRFQCRRHAMLESRMLMELCMSRFLIVILLALVLTSCGTSTKPPAQVSEATLAALNLKDIAVQQGDLPVDALKGTLSEAPDPLFGRDPAVANQYLGMVQEQRYVLGEIFITLYNDTATAHAKYDESISMLSTLMDDTHPQQSPPIGEQASLQDFSEGTKKSTSLSFVRCHAHVTLSLDIASATMLTYAQRLDARLQAVACP